jgi:hypothetical protein
MPGIAGCKLPGLSKKVMFLRPEQAAEFG